MNKTKISSHHFFEQAKKLRELINQMKVTDIPIKLPRGRGTNRMQYIKEQLEYIRTEKQIIQKIAINTAELCLLIAEMLQKMEMFVEVKASQEK